MSIKIIGIKKAFKRFIALDDVSCDVKQGEFLALLGPSGSGKTTLLRIIAGLEIADAGTVFLEGASTTAQPLRERNVGFVFQHYALFRHMTVFDNVAFGLRVRPRENRPSEREIKERVFQLLNLVHLEGLQYQYPSQLSGGQRQRVALARVLAVEPRVMLLDEPFGALDAKVRKELRRWLRKLHDEMHITTIFVTHDQEEAMEIADRVAVMNHGKIVQIGTPEEIWNHPLNAFVYDFLGHYNEFIAWKDEIGKIHLCDDQMLLAIEAQQRTPASLEKRKNFLSRFWNTLLSYLRLTSSEPKSAAALKTTLIETPQNLVKLFVRPFQLILQKVRDRDEDSISARVVHVNPAGSLIKIDLERKNGQIIQAEIAKEVMEELNIVKDDELWMRPKAYKIFEKI